MGTRDAVPAGPSDTNPPAVSQGAGISNKVLPLTYNIGGTNTFPTQFAEFEDKLRQDLGDLRDEDGGPQDFFLQEVSDTWLGVVESALPRHALLRRIAEGWSPCPNRGRWRASMSTCISQTRQTGRTSIAAGASSWECGLVTLTEGFGCSHASTSSRGLQAHALLRRITQGWGHHHCRRMHSSAESRRGGGIIIARDGDRLGLGSSNVVGHVDKKGEPVRGFWGVTSKETPSGWALSNKEVDRDWVFSDLPIEAGVTRAPRLAWEKGHLSVTAVVEKRAVPAESQDILAQVRHRTAQAAAAIQNGLRGMGEAFFRQRVQEVRAEKEDSVREGREVSGGRASSEQPMSKRARQETPPPPPPPPTPPPGTSLWHVGES